MPVADLTNPDVIRFLIESYDKTTRLRMKWNEIYRASVKDSSILHREAKGYTSKDILKSIMTAGMPMTVRDNKFAATNRRLKPIRDGTFIPGIADLRKGHSIPEVGLGDVKSDPRLGRPDTDLAVDPEMRLMDPNQRNIIYQGIPKFGRQVYLKSRHKISPEDKYYFRQTSGGECGWRLNDSYFGRHAPSSHGRVWRLTRDTQSLTGPQPDPSYYKSPDLPGPSKC